MELTIHLLQQMCVYLIFAYILSKTPLILPLLNVSPRFSHRLLCYVLFSFFCILGSSLGVDANNAIANTRAIGTVISGILGGPFVGFAVGLTGGLHRYSLGGFTDLACAISTTLEGLIGGIFHIYFIIKNQKKSLFNPYTILAITLVAEAVQIIIILLVAKPFEQAYELVVAIFPSMIIANAIGAALFMSILQDRKAIVEKYSAAFSQRALNIADSSVGIFTHGLNSQSATEIVDIIYKEAQVGAVAITDTNKILAFVGIGEDHHKVNTPISSKSTLDSIDKKSNYLSRWY